MAFENIEPLKYEIEQMRQDGMTLFQIVDAVKEKHGVTTSTGTLSRFLKTIDVKQELFGVEEVPIIAPQDTHSGNDWLIDFQNRDEKTRNALAQLTTEMRLLVETINDSPLKPIAPAKQKRQWFLSGVGVGVILIIALLIIVIGLSGF